MNQILTHCTLPIVASLLFILLVTFVAPNGIAGAEKTECLAWKQQAASYKNMGFYLTGWQKAQCEHSEIEIDAPVEN